MSAVQLATAYVSLVAEVDGLGKDVAKGLRGIDAQFSQAGGKAGDTFAEAFEKTSKPDTKKLEDAVERAKDRATRASQEVAKAKTKEEDASRKAAIAEKAYAEAVEKSGAESSRALAAEDRMIRAKRDVQHASQGVKAALDAEERALEQAAKESKDLERALEQASKESNSFDGALGRAAAETRELGQAADQADRKVGGFRSKMKNALSSGIGKLNPFKGLSEKAEREGKESGDKFSHKFAGGLKGLGAKIGPAIGAAAAAVGVSSLGALGLDAIKGAGDLEQSVGAINSIFKDSAGQMLAWSDAAAKAVGLSKNEYNELGVLIGAQLKNGGTAMDQLAGKSNELIGVGADLASMFGGTTKEAVEAISSALKGERDPIERYGVSLKQASIDAKAAELGFTKVGGSFSAEAQQAATLALIMEQTADAHGNFAKESDTFAGKQQRLAAQFENLSAQIGEKLLPIASDFLSWLGDSLPAMQEFGDSIWNIGKLLFTGNFEGGIFGLEEDDPIIATLFIIRDAFKSVWDAGVLLFTGDFTSPIFGLEEDHPLIGTLLQMRQGFKALGGAFTQLIQPGGAIRDMLGGLVQGALGIWDALATYVLPIFGDLWTMIAGAVVEHLPTFEGAFRSLGGVFASIGELAGLMGQRIAQVWEWLRPYVEPIINALVGFIGGAFQGLVDYVGGIIDGFVALFKGDWEGLWAAAQRTWDGFWQILKSGWDFFLVYAGTIWDGIKSGVQAAWDGLWQGVNAAWEGFKQPFVDAWEDFKKGIVDVADGLRTGVTDAFEKAKRSVETTWEGIKKAAASPIKFVIATVINDGLIGGVNSLARKIGIKDLIPTVPIPEWMSGYARGGILPGASSWRDGDDQLVPMRRGEGVYVSEVMRDPFERRRLYLMNQAAMRGVPLSIARDRIDGHDHGFAIGGIVSFRGHRFTQNFANRILMAEKLAGGTMHITQGGWRPRTSYSGTSHAGDALDITGGYHRFIAPLRRVGIPTWDRAGKGRWVAHAHGVPLPFAGTAGGSAVWQAQDYLRGGDGLGGRDNGPRVSGSDTLNRAMQTLGGGKSFSREEALPEKAMRLFQEAGEAVIDFVTAPLKMFDEATRGFRDALRNVGGGMLGTIIKGVPNALVGGLKKWLADTVGIPAFANGGVAPGGVALVGERGPELVHLPQGARITPNHQLSTVGTAGVMNVTLTIPAEAIQNLEDLVDFLRRLPLAARRAGWRVNDGR